MEDEKSLGAINQQICKVQKSRYLMFSVKTIATHTYTHTEMHIYPQAITHIHTCKRTYKTNYVRLWIY